MRRSLTPILLLTVTGLVCCGSGSSSSALVDRPGAAPPSLASWFTSPPTPAKASKQAQRKKKGKQNVRPEDDEWVQSLEKVCDRAFLSQVRVKWRQVFGVIGERVSSTTHSLTHPLARASSAVGQRLHALMHFCRAAVPSLSATLAPRAPLLAGVLWGLDQADRVLYKDDDTPPPVVQDLPAKLLHSGMYAMQSHAELGLLLVATATRLVNGLASAAHRFSQRAASLLWGQVNERWESLSIHGLGQRLMGHWRRLGLLRRWVALVEQLLQRLHAAARFLSNSTPALLNGQATPAPLFPSNDTCRSGDKEGKEWAVRDNGSSKPFPSRRWFHPPGLPTDPEPEPPLKPQAKKRVPPSVYSPLRGRVVTVNVRYKFHVNGSAPSSVSPNGPPLTTHTTTTTLPLEADNAVNPPAPAVNESASNVGEEGEERRGVARWLLGRGGGSRPTTHKTRDWGHKVRTLLGLEKKGVEGDETLRAAFGLLGRLAGHFPDAQDVEVLITAAAPSDNPQTSGALPTSTGKQDKTDGAQQRVRPGVWSLLLRGLVLGLFVSLLLLSLAILDKEGVVQDTCVKLLQDVRQLAVDLWAHPRVRVAVEGACNGGVALLLWVRGGQETLAREEILSAASAAAQSLAQTLGAMARSGATAARGAWPWKEDKSVGSESGKTTATEVVLQGREEEEEEEEVKEGRGSVVVEDDEGFEVIHRDAEHDASFVLVEQLPLGDDRGNHPLQ